MEKVLIIDQDPSTREVLSTYLRDIFQVIHGRLEYAARDAKSHEPSVIIFSLDKHFPLKQILPEIRDEEKTRDAIVLAIIADANPMTLEFLNECGIDDFFVRPVDFAHLFWKIRFLQKRNERLSANRGAELSQEVKTPTFSLNPSSGELVFSGKSPLHLTPIQSQILATFVQNPDRLITREWLKMKVWPDREISLRSIDAHISKLRALNVSLAAHIEHVYAKGYIWKSVPKKLTG